MDGVARIFSCAAADPLPPLSFPRTSSKQSCEKVLVALSDGQAIPRSLPETVRI